MCAPRPLPRRSPGEALATAADPSDGRTGTIRVACIVGAGRSGSTLLASLLGQYQGATNLGEVRFLFKRGLHQRRRCGCGVPVPDCPLWSRVWAGVEDRLGPQDPELVAARLDEVMRLRHVRHLGARDRDRTRALRRLGGLADVVEHTLDTALAATGASLLVDASKLPAWACALEALPRVDLTVVHLVRDPHAVAASWARHKVDVDGPGHLERRGHLRTAALWTAWNGLATRWWDGTAHHALVRLEDLLGEPRPVLDHLAGLLGLDPADAPLSGPATAELAPSHSISGNPDRFDTGSVALRPATRPPGRRATLSDLAVAAATAPLARRYGYSAGRGVPPMSRPPR